MHTAERLFFHCPGCGDAERHEVTHFLPDARDHPFGPWQCDGCGGVVSGVWHTASRTVSITDFRTRPKPIEGFMLLRLAPSKTECPLWFVVADTIHTRDGFDGMEAALEHKRYWVDEHTCPTNIVRVEAIIEGQDQDPHGILEFVAWAEKPEGWDDGHDPDWSELFPQIGGPEIEGHAEHQVALIAPPD